MATPQNFSGSIDHLHQLAAQATGLSDFGAGDYLDALKVLALAYDTEARFSETGKTSASNMILNCLIGRLHAQAGLKAFPECIHRDIVRPLFIVGLPRTGTTVLHKLLALDSDHQAVEFWLGMYPMPRPPRSTWESHPRFREISSALETTYRLCPQLKAIHEMRAEEADECRLLLMQSFANVTFQSSATVPSYEKWLYQANFSPVYRDYKNALNLIGLHSPEKRWVLKDPSHLWSLDTLLVAFPDALIVQTHRDPVNVIASVSSLVSTALAMNEPDMGPHEVGRQQFEQWIRVFGTAMKVRDRHPDNFYDVYFDDFMADPLAVIEGIYDRIGATFSIETQSAIHSWLGANPQQKHGDHRYSPDDFGLSADEIADRFSEYRRRFIQSRPKPHAA